VRANQQRLGSERDHRALAVECRLLGDRRSTPRLAPGIADDVDAHLGHCRSGIACMHDARRPLVAGEQQRCREHAAARLQKAWQRLLEEAGGVAVVAIIDA